MFNLNDLTDENGKILKGAALLQRIKKLEKLKKYSVPPQTFFSGELLNFETSDDDTSDVEIVDYQASKPEIIDYNELVAKILRAIEASENNAKELAHIDRKTQEIHANLKAI